MENEREYRPEPIETRDVELPESLRELCETIARNVHEVWAKSRMEDGWVWGPERNDESKQTPCLVDYDQLPETEKDYDRHTAMETLKLIVKLGYRIERKE